MITKHIAPAIDWWLKSQGKSGSYMTGEGEIVETSGGSTVIKGDGSYTIKKWNVDGVTQPNEKEIVKIISDYEADLELWKETKKKRVEKALAKLGLTKEELREILE